MEPKKASGTTSFVVLFASLAGFLGHSALSNINLGLLGSATVASIIGALLGANLLHSKLKNSQVKVIIGVVLYVVVTKIIWGLVWGKTSTPLTARKLSWVERVADNVQKIST